MGTSNVEVPPPWVTVPTNICSSIVRVVIAIRNFYAAAKVVTVPLDPLYFRAPASA